MSIKTLVQSLQKLSHAEIALRGQQIAEENTVYPKGWDTCETVVQKVSSRIGEGYNLRLHAYYDDIYPRTSKLVTTMLEKVSAMQLPSGTYELAPEVSWNVDRFLQESVVGDFPHVTVRSSFSEVDPTRVRIGYRWKTHDIKAVVTSEGLDITATGDYTQLLPQIMEELKPEHAVIQLSESDASRWLDKLSWYKKFILGPLLKPKSVNMISFSSRGPSFGQKEIIQITIPVSSLKGCADAIGRSFIHNSEQDETRLCSLHKEYKNPAMALPDLKKLVGIIGRLKTDTVFGNPLVTTSQADVLLAKEISIVTRSYKNDMPWMQSHESNSQRSPWVKRLAQEYFMEDLVTPLELVGNDEYLQFLMGKGYMYDSASICGAKYAYGDELKEQDLLEFFLQSYEKDKHASVENFRQSYVNEPAKWEIHSKAKIDASSASRLILPSQAELFALSLEDSTLMSDNEVVINTSGGQVGKVHFWIRVALHSDTPLMDIQELACESLGVVFK